MSTPVPPAAPDVALRSVHTSNLPAVLDRLQISLVVSTYQAGKVILIRSAGDTLNTHFRTFTKPMGLAADGARLTIGGTNTVWDYRNIPAVGRTLDPPDQHPVRLRPVAHSREELLDLVENRVACVTPRDVVDSW
jgi:hypothetical protein